MIKFIILSGFLLPTIAQVDAANPTPIPPELVASAEDLNDAATAFYEAAVVDRRTYIVCMGANGRRLFLPDRSPSDTYIRSFIACSNERRAMEISFRAMVEASSVPNADSEVRRHMMLATLEGQRIFNESYEIEFDRRRY